MRIGSTWTCRILALVLDGIWLCCSCRTLVLLAGLAGPAGAAGFAGVAGLPIGSVRGVLNGLIGNANEGFSSSDVIATTNLLQN